LIAHLVIRYSTRWMYSYRRLSMSLTWPNVCRHSVQYCAVYL
jgi:hypothetical protein